MTHRLWHWLSLYAASRCDCQECSHAVRMHFPVASVMARVRGIAAVEAACPPREHEPVGVDRRPS